MKGTKENMRNTRFDKVPNPIRLVIRFLFVSLTVLLMAAVGGGWSFFLHPSADVASLLWVLWLMAVAQGRGMGSGSEFDRGQWIVLAASGFGMMVCYLGAPWEYAHFTGPLPRDGLLAWLGILVFALGVALQIWALRALQGQYTVKLSILEGHHLVTRGPYGIVRHPGYTSHLLCMLGMSLAFTSLLGLAGTLIVIPVLFKRIATEEAMLESQFGEEYRAYRESTGRLLPKIRDQ
jgi:protein-S-isoprenylcysteine O-methyltransferase Ste14